MSLSLVSPFVVGGLALAAVASVGLRAVAGRLALVVTAVLLVLAVAAGVNEYFDYIPTVGALLGRRARDQASPAQVLHAVTASRRLRRGLVETVDIPAPRSGFRTRPAQVYLPPAWFAQPRPQLPVLELLHGTPGSPADWTRAGAADVTADAWASGHDGLAPIIVMVDENGGFTRDTECVDGRLGRADTYVVDDVHDWAVTAVGARADRAGWAIGGSSEGGWCALVLGLRHPDRFATLLDFSGLDRPTHHGGIRALFRHPRRGLRAYEIARLARRRPPVSAWLAVGTADGRTTRAVRHAARLLAANGVDTRLALVPHAHHTWRVWRHCLADAFPWVASRLGLAPA